MNKSHFFHKIFNILMSKQRIFVDSLVLSVFIHDQ